MDIFYFSVFLIYIVIFICIFDQLYISAGAWGSLVVKAAGSIPSGVAGDFSIATDGTMCPGVHSASENEYQDIPGGKNGRCIKVTILPPSQRRKSRKCRSLNLPDPQACSGL
jgi:hypothetical protein